MSEKSELVIIQHGINWITRGELPVCPECNYDSLGHLICNDEAKQIFTAQFSCCRCGCEFIIQRGNSDTK